MWKEGKLEIAHNYGDVTRSFRPTKLFMEFGNKFR